MLTFGKALPKIREKIQVDLKRRQLSEEKVLAAVIALMEQTKIRVGNYEYEKQNGSFGLTTLKDKHARIEGTNINFFFKGKRGIKPNISLSDRRLAKIVKSCRVIPRRELFQYYDKEGNRQSIDSGMVNQSIKLGSGGDFSAKDFRTCWGSVHALKHLIQKECPEDDKSCKQQLIATFDYVGFQLGNTRNVCRKYYIHPAIISNFEKGILPSNGTPKIKTIPGLSEIENMLIHILRNTGRKEKLKELFGLEP